MQRGFTFIELIVVIVIVGILSAYLVAQNPNAVDLTLQSQAESVAADMRYAQSLAFTSGSRGLFILDGNTAYKVCKTTNGTDCSVEVKAGRLEKGVTISGTAASVSFSTSGEPGSTPTFTLTTPSTITRSISISNRGNITVP